MVSLPLNWQTIAEDIKAREYSVSNLLFSFPGLV